MTLEIFGFSINRKKTDAADKKINQLSVTATTDDGSTVLSTGAAGSAGYYGYSFDIEGMVKTEDELIKKYRDAAFYPDCDSAIDDIINEVITTDEDEKTVELNLDSLELGDPVKKKINETFETILELLNFTSKGHDIVRQWYIDGRLYYYVIVDPKNAKEGIQKITYIDPRKIRKIKNVKKKKNANGIDVIENIETYYIYNDKGVSSTSNKGIKLSEDSVVYVPSGYMDNNTGMGLGFMHKAIKPVNQLKMIEDAFVIYTISRAPQRRVFYIDVGSLQKQKAEQYVQDIMAKFRNKITYDAQTGEVKDDKKNMSILEDFWLPRAEGSRGTEISTLAGGDSLIGNDTLQYFQQKLFQSLNVPVSRLQPNQAFSLGRSSEITRDELKFNKFILRLRKKFSPLFYDLLKIQLIATGVMTLEDWDVYKKDIKVDFRKDNYFTEFKETEIIQGRVGIAQLIDPFIGKYYSIEWVRKHVLMQSDDEMKEMDKQMTDEKKAGSYDLPEPDNQQ